MNGDELKKALSGLIQLEMERQRLTRTDLARRMGCTFQNVDQLLHREGGMHLESAAKLAAALGYRLELRLVPLAGDGKLMQHDLD